MKELPKIVAETEVGATVNVKFGEIKERLLKELH